MTRELTQSKKQGLQVASQNSVLPDLSLVNSYIDSVIDSKLVTGFERPDPNDPKKKIVDRSDIFTAIVLGMEMNISPAGSLLLGSKLNKNSYFSAIRGKEIGMGATSAINNIHTIDTANGKIQSLGVNAINMCLNKGGVELDILADYQPSAIYVDAYTKRYVGHALQLFGAKPTVFVFQDKIHTKEEVQKAKDKGLLIVERVNSFTYATSIKFTRPSTNTTITITYCLQEAIDAELFRGFHSTLVDKDGKPLYIKGKSNWNNHPAVMLRNRPLSIGGRIIVADLMQGGYSQDEVVDMVNQEKGTDYTTIEDIEST